MSVGLWTRSPILPGYQAAVSAVTWLQGQGRKQLIAQGLFQLEGPQF